MIIHYLSGTGNSLRIALAMAEKAAEQNTAVTMIPVEKYVKNKAENKNDPSQALLALFTPTHGFTAPWKFYKHVLSLPRSRGTHALVTATRACLKFGKVFVPGISGSGTFITAFILLLKGYKVRGITSIDMPSNWMPLHPAQKIASQKSIISRGTHKAEKFIEKILTGKTEFISRTNIFELIWALLLSWISVLYLCYGRFVLSKLFFANYTCTGCGLCAAHCPTNSIKMIGKKNPLPFWKYSCESCMRCMGYCPEQAIEAGHSWGVLLYFIGSIPMFVIVLEHLSKLMPSGAAGSLGLTAVRWFIWLMAIFLSYYAFHFSLRIPVVNRFFSWTTLTHWYRRYHEPEIKINELPAKPVKYL